MAHARAVRVPDFFRMYSPSPRCRAPSIRAAALSEMITGSFVKARVGPVAVTRTTTTIVTEFHSPGSLRRQWMSGTTYGPWCMIAASHAWT